MPFPLIAGLAGTLGSSLLGGLFGHSAQSSANRQNIKLQEKQLAWEKMMSDTAHQRETKDYLAAGLNPMLAVGAGGASTPSVSAATVQPEDAMAKSISNLGGGMMQAIQAANIQANTAKTVADKEYVQAQTPGAAVTSGNAAARQAKEMEEIDYRINNYLVNSQLTAKETDRLTRLVPTMVAQAQAELERTGQVTSSAKTAQELDKLKIPSAKAEADVWEKLGAAGRGANIGANALQQVIAIIKSVLGK